MQEDSTKDESTKKAAIYVRDSSTGPDAGNSLQAQTDACNQHCSEEGAQIATVYSRCQRKPGSFRPDDGRRHGWHRALRPHRGMGSKPVLTIRRRIHRLRRPAECLRRPSRICEVAGCEKVRQKASEPTH